MRAEQIVHGVVEREKRNVRLFEIGRVYFVSEIFALQLIIFRFDGGIAEIENGRGFGCRGFGCESRCESRCRCVFKKRIILFGREKDAVVFGADRGVGGKDEKRVSGKH